jgi:hypothetical protein
MIRRISWRSRCGEPDGSAGVRSFDG